VLLNENFQFTRPVTVTGAYLLPDRYVDGNFFSEEVFFHQMVVDRVDVSTNEYVIHNTSFNEGGAVLRIEKRNEYYGCDQNAVMNNFGQYKLFGQNGEEWSLVHEIAGNMKPKTWYLLPQAYSIILTPEQIQPSVSPPVQQVNNIFILNKFYSCLENSKSGGFHSSCKRKNGSKKCQY
jgi:hypothetical protein